MEHIKTIHCIPWKHIFILETSDEYNGRTAAKKQIEEWAINNCTGQWLIGRTYEITLNANPICDIPLTKKQYPISSVNIKSPIIIVFEREDEATAFKLVFYGD